MGKASCNGDAIADLTALRRYIAQHNPSAAQRVAARIVKWVNRLATHPQFGKVGRVEGTRKPVIPQFPCTIVDKEH